VDDSFKFELVVANNFKPVSLFAQKENIMRNIDRGSDAA
jgi:hypothetical protein